MDAQGFLPISLIASFHRVQALTMDINLIMEVMAPHRAARRVRPVGSGLRPKFSSQSVFSFSPPGVKMLAEMLTRRWRCV